ncbi:hypothetical protein [Nocardia paucivorans]|uniref:hypothetical protein n=1 Tax=Nocardia paucivorans TaxID=114259 RepID=UPI0002D27D17|nr:hypothetical protein [Nocardia paucivorans]
MTTTESCTQTRTWTFVLRRNDPDTSRTDIADGAVFDDGTTVLRWRRRDGHAPATVVADLRHIVERYCFSGGVRLIWVTGGPQPEGQGRHTDSICLSCYAPMLEVPVDHGVIQHEGHCPDCGIREVWELYF